MPDDRMIFTASECERHTLLPGKNTVIMATCQSVMPVFATSFMSALIKSNPEKVEHFVVCINGADSRTHDTSLQDSKQSFLEDVRKLKWHGRDMPLTVIRAWSRIGHTQAMEMAIPWVHTELYTIIHDDVIVTSGDWADEAQEKLLAEEVAVCQEFPVLQMSTGEIGINGKTFINLPHINSSLCVCKKRAITETGQRWYGYHFEKDFVIRELVNEEMFLEHNKQWIDMDNFVDTAKKYGGASVDIGGLVWSALKRLGYKMVCFDSPKSVHMRGMSWCCDVTTRNRLRLHAKTMNETRRELSAHPELYRIYEKYGGLHAELL